MDDELTRARRDLEREIERKVYIDDDITLFDALFLLGGAHRDRSRSRR